LLFAPQSLELLRMSLLVWNASSTSVGWRKAFKCYPIDGGCLTTGSCNSDGGGDCTTNDCVQNIAEPTEPSKPLGAEYALARVSTTHERSGRRASVAKVSATKIRID
jgi:hypothetical protein